MTDSQSVIPGSPAGPARRAIGPADLVRWMLAAILLVAAALKVEQLGSEPVNNCGQLGCRWIAIVEAECEIVLGLWLLSGLAQDYSRIMGGVCFGAFACVTLFKAYRGEASCGCFGKVEINPWYTLLLDLLAVAVLLLFQRAGRSPPRNLSQKHVAQPPSAVNVAQPPSAVIRPPEAGEIGPGGGQLGRSTAEAAVPHSSCAGVQGLPSRPSARRITAYVFAAVAMIVSGLAAWPMIAYQPARLTLQGDINGRGAVLLDPADWPGQQLPLLTGRHLTAEPAVNLRSGEWTLFLYRSTCRDCQRALAVADEQARQSVASKQPVRIVVAELPPVAGPGQDAVKPDSPLRRARLDPSRKWFVHTPLIVSLKNGMVTGIAWK